MNQSHLQDYHPCNLIQQCHLCSQQQPQLNNPSVVQQGQNSANLFYRSKIIFESQSEDSAVSFQQNILDQHLQFADFEIQNTTKLIFKFVNYDQLLADRLTDSSGERPFFLNYLDWDLSLIKRQEVPIFTSLLNLSVNSYKFLEEIFSRSPQFLVHQLVFISYQVLKVFNPAQSLLCTMSQLKQLSSDHRFLKIISDHSQLTILSYSNVLGDRSVYQKPLKKKVKEFLVSYVLTCLLVRENYFINPYYEKMKRRQLMEKKRKYRDKFNRRQRLRKKIENNCVNKQLGHQRNQKSSNSSVG